MYIYYHNWFCHKDGNHPDDSTPSPKSSFGRLFWFGSRGPTNWTKHVLLQDSGDAAGLNDRWNQKGQNFYACDLPPEAQAALFRSFDETTKCVSGRYQGVSLIEAEDSNLD